MVGKCKICNNDFDNIGAHVVQFHGFTAKEYYNQFLKDNILNKICNRCNENKPTYEFGKHKLHIDGLQSICKQCKKQIDINYIKLHKLEKKEYDKQREIKITKEEKIKKNNRRRQLYKNNLKRRIYNRSWKRNNPNKILLQVQKRRVLLQSQRGDFTEQDWINIKNSYKNKCAYCRSDEKLTIDHIIPLSIGGKHDKNNIVPACCSCNSTKWNKIWIPLKIA